MPIETNCYSVETYKNDLEFRIFQSNLRKPISIEISKFSSYYFDIFLRLREILMVASANIKTPSMEVPFLPNVSDKAKDALRISLNKVTLANVLEAVHVTETIQMSGGCRKRLIKMRFEFLPKKQYKNQVCTA